MKTIRLDGRKMGSPAQTHAYLKRRLCLPEYYGRNLDALHDCLMAWSEPAHIIFLYQAECMAVLGRYGHGLLRVLRDVAEENPALTVSLAPASTETGKPEDEA